MNLSDLQDKELIDISSGKRLGNIIDIIISMKGEVQKLVLEDKKGNRKIFGGTKEELTISWNKIKKIGDDIILVDFNNNISY